MARALTKHEFSSILEFFLLVLPLSQELPLTASPAASQNLTLPWQVVGHEQQQYSGGLLFLLSPLDDAVIEAPSHHPNGLAAHTGLL